MKGTSEKFSDAYLIFLQSANLPSSLEDDIRRLSEHQYEEEGANTNEVLKHHFMYLNLHVIVSFYRNILPMTNTKLKTGC